MTFQRFAGASAYAVAAGGVAYAISFVVAVKTDSGAGETTAASLLLGVVGAVGSAIHGGFDLALRVHPTFDTPGIPNEVDPRACSRSASPASACWSYRG